MLDYHINRVKNELIWANRIISSQNYLHNPVIFCNFAAFLSINYVIQGKNSL